MILIIIAGLLLFFYMSVGMMIPIIKGLENKMKWYSIILLAIVYSIFWFPMMIASYIIRRWGV